MEIKDIIEITRKSIGDCDCFIFYWYNKDKKLQTTAVNTIEFEKTVEDISKRYDFLMFAQDPNAKELNAVVDKGWKNIIRGVAKL